MVKHTESLFIFNSIVLGIVGTLSAKVCDPDYAQVGQSRLGVLISPIITRRLRNEIEIYWSNMDFQSGDRIALYDDTDPLNIFTPLYTVEATGPSGVVQTGIEAESAPIRNPFTKQCIRYRVDWIRDKTIKTDCMKTEPTWMRDKKDILGSRRISQIFLPGTHNSAAYIVNATTKGDLITNYAVAQDVDVLTQLIRGVRYLDIRVGHKAFGDVVWWTFHGILYRSVPLKTVIDQVKRFLDNTEEIVIFDVHEFPVGFGDGLSLHLQLVSYLEEQFHGYYLTTYYHGWHSTLNNIWSSGKRLIIGYGKREIPDIHKSMWPSVLHRWGDVRTVENLFNYLNKIESKSREDSIRPQSTMAQLTPNEIYITINLWSSLRNLAHKVNVNVTTWYSTIWQYNANIVAVDFLRSTDIVDVAIASNKNRHLHCHY